MPRPRDLPIVSGKVTARMSDTKIKFKFPFSGMPHSSPINDITKVIFEFLCKGLQRAAGPAPRKLEKNLCVVCTNIIVLNENICLIFFHQVLKDVGAI